MLMLCLIKQQMGSKGMNELDSIFKIICFDLLMKVFMLIFPEKTLKMVLKRGWRD